MRKFLIATITSATLLVPTAAQALPASEGCGESYLILPDGQCLDITYMTVLPKLHSDVATAKAIYNRALRANVAFESNPYNRVLESKEEKAARYEALATTKEMKDTVEQTGQQLETAIYLLHLKRLGQVERAFRNRR